MDAVPAPINHSRLVDSDAELRHPGISSYPWQTPALVVTLSWIVTLVLYWRSLKWMVETWQSSTYSHGFLVLPISLFLIWVSRRRVAPLPPAPNPRYLPFLAVLALGWMLANLVGVLVVQELALVAMLQVLVLTLLGRAVVRALLFPLAFLLFAVPAGESLIAPLQDFTAHFSVKALELSGVPVVLEGRIISIPSGTWEVAQACSGVRYLISSVTLGCMYAWVVYRSWVRRLGFILVSALVPILANGVRAYVIIMLGHISNNRVAVGIDHLIYGWFFFAVVIILLFTLGWRWRELNDLAARPIGHQSHPPEVLRGTENKIGSRKEGLTRTLALTAASGITVLALGPIGVHLYPNRLGAPITRIAALSVTPPWEPLAQYTGNWAPGFQGADAELMQSYTSGPHQVHLYIAYYARQEQGRKLLNPENYVADGRKWVQLDDRQARVEIDGRALSVRETRIASGHGDRLVWSWYWIADGLTSNPYQARLLQAKAILLGRPQGSAVIALAADYGPDRGAAAAVLQDFLRHTSVQATLNTFSK